MAAFQSETLLGEQIDHYRLDDVLLRRPGSTLYCAHDTANDTPIFLELCHATGSSDPELAGRFHQRMKTAAQLSHPAILPITHVGYTADERPFALITHTPGQFLSANPPTQLTPQEALQLIRPLVSALTVAHPTGLFHHDLRPDTIYLTANQEPRLLDLGVPVMPLSRDLNWLRENQQLDYAAPEQLRGMAVTAQSNIYSLGVLLYELLSGQRPPLPLSEWSIFDKRPLPLPLPLSEVQPGLPPEVYTLVKNCLWEKEWNRYDSAAHMLEDIHAALTAVQQQTAVSTSPTIPWRKYLPYAAGFLVIIAIAATLLLLTR